MIKIKLDENIGIRGKGIFQKSGFDVKSVYDENLCSASDNKIIEVCKNEKRILITLDLDFSNPLVYKPSKFNGIAVIRLSSKPTPTELNKCIINLANTLNKKKDINGKLWIIQHNVIREYQEED